MKKLENKRVMISVYDSQWQEFRANCDAQYKTASGMVRELITEWNKKCQKQKEQKMAGGKK
jgi:hypothetical protein